MLKFIAKKLLQMIPMLLLISFIILVLCSLPVLTPSAIWHLRIWRAVRRILRLSVSGWV